MIYMGIDPGKRTGVCASSDHGFSLAFRAVMDQEQLCKWLSLVDGEASIIYEEFKLYDNKSQQLVMQQLWAPETIGMIKAIAWQKGWQIKPQWAATAKGAVSDAQLKKRGYIFNSSNVEGIIKTDEVRHAKDSGRHLLYHVDYAPPV